LALIPADNVAYFLTGADICWREPSPARTEHRLEQLRVLETGYPIAVGIVHELSIGINTSEDYQRSLHDSQRGRIARPEIARDRWGANVDSGGRRGMIIRSRAFLRFRGESLFTELHHRGAPIIRHEVPPSQSSSPIYLEIFFQILRFFLDFFICNRVQIYPEFS
jgi:hypothetical protein